MNLENLKYYYNKSVKKAELFKIESENIKKTLDLASKTEALKNSLFFSSGRNYYIINSDYVDNNPYKIYSKYYGRVVYYHREALLNGTRIFSFKESNNSTEKYSKPYACIKVNYGHTQNSTKTLVQERSIEIPFDYMSFIQNKNCVNAKKAKQKVDKDFLDLYFSLIKRYGPVKFIETYPISTELKNKIENFSIFI